MLYLTNRCFKRFSHLIHVNRRVGSEILNQGPPPDLPEQFVYVWS